MHDDAPQGYYATSAAPLPPASPLTSNIRANVCVIGGGYTGLSAALHLANAGAKVVLLEAEEVGFAASGRNGGQIHPGHRKTQAELEGWLGVQHARDLWSLSEEARQLVFTIASEDCELKHGLVIAAHDVKAARDLAAETEYLASKYGYDNAQILGRAATYAAIGSEIYPASRLDSGGGHLHPLKFVRRLASQAAGAGAAIHEHSAALGIESATRHTVYCRHGTVDAEQLVLACDAFSGRIAPRLASFIAHVESFIIATARLEPALAHRIVPADAAVADTRHVLDYYRKSLDNRLLFAGREAYWSPPRDVARLVRPRMLRVFPQLKDTEIEFAWSGTVGITRTRMPHFGTLGTGIFFAHGYSGHGVALATLGGRLLAEAVLGNRERFDIVARVPAKPFPGGPLLRKPMVTVGLVALKLLDSL